VTFDEWYDKNKESLTQMILETRYKTIWAAAIKEISEDRYWEGRDDERTIWKRLV